MRTHPPTPAAPLRQALDELQRADEGRYGHRLHALLLVCIGHSCVEVARWFGEHPRTVERWFRGYVAGGLECLRGHGRGGRPSSLSSTQRQRLALDLQASPRAAGYAQPCWSGKLVARHLHDHFAIDLSLRQCQRLLRAFGLG